MADSGFRRIWSIFESPLTFKTNLFWRAWDLVSVWRQFCAHASPTWIFSQLFANINSVFLINPSPYPTRDRRQVVEVRIIKL